MSSLLAGIVIFAGIAIYAAGVTSHDAKADRGRKPVFSYAKLKEVVQAPAEKAV